MLQENSKSLIAEQLRKVPGLKRHPVLGNMYIVCAHVVNCHSMRYTIQLGLYSEIYGDAYRSVTVDFTLGATKYPPSMGFDGSATSFAYLAVLNMMDELRLEVRDPEESAFWYPKTCGR